MEETSLLRRHTQHLRYYIVQEYVDESGKQEIQKLYMTKSIVKFLSMGNK